MSGIDLSQTPAPLTNQRLGIATREGYLEISNVEGLGAQRLGGASALNFNFATNRVTGNANNFGVYSLTDTSGNNACTAETSTFTKVRGVGGQIDFRSFNNLGRINGNGFELLAIGTLTDTAGNRTYELSEAKLNGSLFSTAENTSIGAFVPSTNATIFISTIGSGVDNQRRATVTGRWRQLLPAKQQ